MNHYPKILYFSLLIIGCSLNASQQKRKLPILAKGDFSGLGTNLRKRFPVTFKKADKGIYDCLDTIYKQLSEEDIKFFREEVCLENGRFETTNLEKGRQVQAFLASRIGDIDQKEAECARKVCAYAFFTVLKHEDGWQAFVEQSVNMYGKRGRK